MLHVSLLHVDEFILSVSKNISKSHIMKNMFYCYMVNIKYNFVQ